mgnify:CR=1 FL=1
MKKIKYLIQKNMYQKLKNFEMSYDNFFTNNAKIPIDDAKEITSERTLLGDYFFSQFSLSLIPIDSTKLIDTFSDYIKQSVVPETFDKEKSVVLFIERRRI